MDSEEKENELRENFSTDDLEIGSVFHRKAESHLNYIYIGCVNIYSFEQTDNTIFITQTQVEDVAHVFYCKERNDFSTFKWTTAEKLDKKVSEEEMKEIINLYRTYPIGVKVKEAEFHINHLNFNDSDIPLNITSTKAVLFSRSSFKEICPKHKIYLVFEWDENTKYPNLTKFTPHIISLIESENFSFDYIPQEHWGKYKELFNLDKVNKIISDVHEIASKQPGLLSLFSSSMKNKFFMEKLKKLQAMKLGALYLINEKIK